MRGLASEISADVGGDDAAYHPAHERETETERDLPLHIVIVYETLSWRLHLNGSQARTTSRIHGEQCSLAQASPESKIQVRDWLGFGDLVGGHQGHLGSFFRVRS